MLAARARGCASGDATACTSEAAADAAGDWRAREGDADAVVEETAVVWLGRRKQQRPAACGGGAAPSEACLPHAQPSCASCASHTHGTHSTQTSSKCMHGIGREETRSTCLSRCETGR
ncbi:hypothetical protein FA09DRAFT_145993 [Tilletiopsis washingtonensis]|uniref:Uncharacterized protein n=1 Tax=Tilletiopsis washingtonensis TaxID=58919 RepID=A0A316Z500_9BASI|nr:hypothetical protein FA09DRAFT_145993 [Tilletiopsis washingtonensis]PWN95285.1 hypothetical protein FA09DRAFT_145993 [Tilletiopsis washingtonensis]